MKQLDAFDRQLLDLLAADARRTGEQLSQLVGLSPAACLRRVQRLREIGAIEKEVAIVGSAYQGGGTGIVVLLTVRRHNPKQIDDLCHRLARQRQVERVISVTGDDDIVLLMNCASMAEFADFCLEYFDDDPVEGYTTLVSLREYDTSPV